MSKTATPPKPKADDKAGAAGDDNQEPAGGDDKNKLPYPEGVAVADMTPEQQVAYWKFHAQKHEAAWQKKIGGQDITPEALADLQTRLAEYEKANLSDAEKAVAEAYEKGKAEATAAASTIAVKALVDARKAHLDDEKDADTIESLDLIDTTKFINTDGTVDSVRLTKILDRLAPTGGGASNSNPSWPATGQGHQSTGTGSAKDAGKAEAERRFGKGE